MTKIKHPTAATLKKWTRMTDENDHDAVRIEIANWCKAHGVYTGACATNYARTKAEHERAGCLTPLAQFARRGTDNLFDSYIRDVDADLADKIHACL